MVMLFSDIKYNISTGTIGSKPSLYAYLFTVRRLNSARNLAFGNKTQKVLESSCIHYVHSVRIRTIRDGGLIVSGHSSGPGSERWGGTLAKNPLSLSLPIAQSLLWSAMCNVFGPGRLGNQLALKDNTYRRKQCTLRLKNVAMKGVRSVRRLVPLLLHLQDHNNDTCSLLVVASLMTTTTRTILIHFFYNEY
jgi:hypothetical protein